MGLKARVAKLKADSPLSNLSLPNLKNFSISLIFVVVLILAFFIAITISSVTSNYPDVISVLIIIVVISVILFSLVLKPIMNVVQEMKKVSELDFSVLDKKYNYSPIKEVKNIEQIFIRLVSTMKLYKSFVPAGLFEQDDDSEDEAGHEDSHYLNVNNMTSAGYSSSDGMSMVTPSTKSPAGKKYKAKDWFQNRLKASGKRMAVVLIVNINNYNELISKMITKDLVFVHKKYVNAVMNCVREQNGVIDRFCADKIEATWGGIKKYKEELSPSIAACQAALSIQTTINNLNVDLEKQGYPSISVRIGIDRGYVCLSVFGPLSMKQKACQGIPFSNAYNLEKLNKKIGTSVLVSQRIQEDINGFEKFRVRPVDIVKSTYQEDENSGAMLVYELKDSSSLLKESWMHKFESKEIELFNKLYTSAFDSFKHKDFEHCIQILEELNTKMNYEDPVCNSLLKRSRIFLILKQNIPNLNLSELDVVRSMDSTNS